MEFFLFFFLYLTCSIVTGVCGDEVTSVSVTEGGSVTLHTDVIKQKDDLILWCYGPENTIVAKINGEAGSTMLTKGEIFRDRLKLSEETADLSIANVTTQHTGPYTLRISSNNKVTYKNFNVTVHVPVKQTQRQDVPRPCHECSESPKQQANVFPAVVISVISSSIIIFIISFFIYRRAKANTRTLSEGEHPTKINLIFGSTSKHQEALSVVKGKQHRIGAGSV